MHSSRVCVMRVPFFSLPPHLTYLKLDDSLETGVGRRKPSARHRSRPSSFTHRDCGRVIKSRREMSRKGQGTHRKSWETELYYYVPSVNSTAVLYMASACVCIHIPGLALIGTSACAWNIRLPNGILSLSARFRVLKRLEDVVVRWRSTWQSQSRQRAFLISTFLSRLNICWTFLVCVLYIFPFWNTRICFFISFISELCRLQYLCRMKCL